MGSQPLDPKLMRLLSTPEGRRHLAYHMINPVKVDPDYVTVDGMVKLSFSGKLYASWAELREHTQKLSLPPPCPICGPGA